MAIRADGATVKNKAVVFCLGVNDLQNVQEYVSFYRTIAPTLKALKCDLYLTSVNPFLQKQRELYKSVVTGKSEYREWRSYGQKILLNRAFQNLEGYTYIDTSSYLFKTGFAYARSRCGDGLHFSRRTNKKVLKYILKKVG